MEWARRGLIGFNAAGDEYINHPLSGETGTPSIACSGGEWTNVIYKLSVNNPTGTEAPPTVEPRMLKSHLMYELHYLHSSICMSKGHCMYLVGVVDTPLTISDAILVLFTPCILVFVSQRQPACTW